MRKSKSTKRTLKMERSDLVAQHFRIRDRKSAICSKERGKFKMMRVVKRRLWRENTARKKTKIWTQPSRERMKCSRGSLTRSKRVSSSK